MSAMISISGLQKSYKNKQVLNDVNLTLSAGQILGLVGPNGAGKTTCLQALLGLTCYEGDIDVLGYNPSKNRVKMLADVAYIADVAVLPKWIKVGQALTYMQGVHPKRLRRIRKGVFRISRSAKALVVEDPWGPHSLWLARGASGTGDIHSERYAGQAVQSDGVTRRRWLGDWKRQAFRRDYSVAPRIPPCQPLTS